MTEAEERDFAVKITNTWVGREYGWDSLLDVKWWMLKRNLESAEMVLANPQKFPKADRERLEEQVTEIHMLLTTDGHDRDYSEPRY